ncbi:hypothetical protein C8Q75DRAFT_763418 [Abortiporus biennis]|nr:hypothetical protein C8Q75DRAFT_763418 [Abortiporus biennis]
MSSKKSNKLTPIPNTSACGRVLQPGSHLKNTTTFPPFSSCPDESDLDLRYYADPYSSPSFSGYPKRHWCFLGEIKDFVVFTRLVVDVEDIEGRQCRIAMYDDERGKTFAEKKGLVKVGHTVAVLYPTSHQFMDLSEGFRVEEASNIMFIPCSLQQLFDADSKIRSPLSTKCCNDDCDKSENLQACSVCRVARYCGKEHQTAHWKTHKAECKAISALAWFHDKDWTRFRNGQWFSFPPP